LNDWKIQSLRNACVACAKEFENDETVFSAIQFAEEEGQPPTRTDYCGGCRPAEAPGGIYWQTRWQIPAPKKKKVDFDRLLRVFEAWLERPKGSDPELLYLIGLLLIRKRFFKMLDLASIEDEEYLRLRRPGTEEEPFLLPAPLLQPEQLPELRKRLEALIDGEVEHDDLESVGSSVDSAVP
jgi:hypothetical protein